MASITFPTATRNAAADAVVDLLDAGAGAGKVEFYTAGFATLLAEMTLQDPAFGAAAAGVATMNLPGAGYLEDSSANASGTIAASRWKDSNGTVVLESDAGAGGSVSISFLSAVVTAGEPVRLLSCTYTHPSSAIT